MMARTMLADVGGRVDWGKEEGWPACIAEARERRELIREREGEGGMLMILVTSWPESPVSDIVTLSQAGREWRIWSGVRELREELNLVSLDLIQRLNIFSACLSTNYDISARLELSFF